MRDDAGRPRAVGGRDDLANGDVVSGGPARVSRRHRRLLIGVLCVTVTLALVAAWGDRLQRAHEFGALVTSAADAQASVRVAAHAVESTRAYAMPLLVSSSSVTVRVGLAQLIDDAAAREETSVREARDAVARIDVLPWHDKLRAAKASMLAYLDRRVADLDFVAHGGDLAALTSATASVAAAGASKALRAAASSDADAAKAARVFATPPPS